MSYFKQISRNVSVDKIIETTDKLAEEHQWSNFKEMAARNREQQMQEVTNSSSPSIKKRLSAFVKRILG